MMMMVIVADSSYIVEGILKDSSLLGDQVLCAPDYSLYEVLNAIRKHQVLLKRIRESEPILGFFFELIEAQQIRFIALAEKTIKTAYELALKTRTPIYDTGFVALARDLGVELKTLDDEQAKIFRDSF